MTAADAPDGATGRGVRVGVLDSGWDRTQRVVYRPGDAVECLANGMHVGVRWLGGERRVVTGTSFAAPVVSGAVARLRELHPDADLDAVRDLLARAG